MEAAVTSFLRGCVLALAAALLLSAPAWAEGEIDVPAGPQPKAVLKALVTALATHGPLAEPSDRGALESCRAGLAGVPGIEELFRAEVDWGAALPETPFWKLKSEPVDRASLIGHTLPLFMFDGAFRAERKRNEAWVVLRMTAVPRKLDVPDLPHPPWPSIQSRQALASARELVLAVDPVENEVWYVLHSAEPAAQAQ
jgi:hypothetical protein